MSFNNFEALKLGFINYLQEKMNSEEIIEVVDTKETPQNEVSAEFNEILKKTLENN